jgi:hypothetical protein
MSLAEGTSDALSAARLGEALTAEAKNAEIVALAARYEGIGETLATGEEDGEAAMSEVKSVAAE